MAEEGRVHRAQIWRATDSGEQSEGFSPGTKWKNLAVLSPNTAISNLTRTGSVRPIAGSDDESGTAILKSLPSGSARSDISLSSGTPSEIYRSSSLSTPAILHQIPSRRKASWYTTRCPEGMHRALNEVMNYRIFTGPFVSFHAYFCNKKVSTLSK